MFLLWQVLCGGKVAAMLQACALGSAWKHLRLRLECMIDIGVSPGNHGDSVVLLDRIEYFAPLGRIQKCWLFAHQNMQKPLYTDVIDQNIDNIFLL